MGEVILITGASGFVGSHYAKYCLNKGDEVVSILHDDKPVTPSKLLGIHDKIIWCRGDILNESFLKRVVSDYEVNSVIHFSALPIVRVGTRTTTPIFETNVMGTIKLLEAVKEQYLSGHKIRFLYFNSDKSYGYAKSDKPYTEETCLSGLNVYDCSKAMASLVCHCYYNSFKIPMADVRVCNIYGPADTNSRLIPNTIRNCIAGKSPVIFKGINYVREFIYVDDVCDAVFKVLENIQPDKISIYNIGSGIWMDQKECIRIILKYFPGLEPVYRKPPDYTRVEIPYQRLDTSKIQRELGWKSRFTFEESLRETVRWYRSHGRHCPFEPECGAVCTGSYERCAVHRSKAPSNPTRKCEACGRLLRANESLEEGLCIVCRTAGSERKGTK